VDSDFVMNVKRERKNNDGGARGEGEKVKKETKLLT